MKKGIAFFYCLFCLILSGLGQGEKIITNFKLLNINGKYVSLKDYPLAKGFMIVFTSNHCPFAKLYPERLNKLNAKYSPLGVPLIAISSTDTISYEEDTYNKMVEKASSEHFNYPYLYDGMQTIAKEFGAQRTPHAFLIWKVNNSWLIKYKGAIDDNGAHPELVQNNYLENAVKELLLGNDILEKETKSIGCQIYFRN